MTVDPLSSFANARDQISARASAASIGPLSCLGLVLGRALARSIVATSAFRLSLKA